MTRVGSSEPAAAIPAAQLSLFGGRREEIDWFHLDPRPCLEVDRELRVRRLNPAAEALLEDGGVFRVADTRLIFDDASAQADILHSLDGGAVSGAHSLVVRASPGCWRSVDVILPPEGRSALLSVGRCSDLSRLSTAPVAKAFGLTPAESQVLSALVRGKAPKDAARLLAISPATVRAHLRRIYSKFDSAGLTKTAIVTALLSSDYTT